MIMRKLKVLKAKKIFHNNGSIIVLEEKAQYKFNFKRIFYVFAGKNKIRGNHAHKKCIQLINCLNGSVEITCEDLKRKKYKFFLNDPKKYLIIQSMIWSTQKYLKKNSIVSVLCSEKFSEKDYIRNYSSYVKLSKK